MKYPETASELYSLSDFNNKTKEFNFVQFLLENRLVDPEKPQSGMNSSSRAIPDWRG